MKLYLPIILSILLFSCKKEIRLPIDSVANNKVSFFGNIKAQLKDSLSISDDANIDTNRMYRSKDAQSKGCFVRIGLINKNIATDFLLLKTDTSGKISEGKIIHVDKEYSKTESNRIDLTVAIASLDRMKLTNKAIVNGKFKPLQGTTDMLEAPAGEQTLPDCVITCYTTDGSDEGDWYWYGGFFDQGGGGGSYTYGYSDGGGEGSSDNTIQIEVESDDNPSIKVEDYIKCFGSVPDANAIYCVTIFSDLPVNSDPYKIFNCSTGSPGHSFIQLSKYNGNQSIQQNFGFYPENGWKAASNADISSKVVDNEGHEFNASLSLTISGSQFQAALNRIQTIANYDYNITEWNCTDFALSVFNAASASPLSIPKVAIPTSQYPVPTPIALSNTPQGLYDEIQTLQATHNTTLGNTDVPNICSYAGNSHGSCQ